MLTPAKFTCWSVVELLLRLCFAGVMSSALIIAVLSIAVGPDFWRAGVLLAVATLRECSAMSMLACSPLVVYMYSFGVAIGTGAVVVGWYFCTRYPAIAEAERRGCLCSKWYYKTGYPAIAEAERREREAVAKQD